MRGQIKGTKANAGTREVMLNQPQAKEVLLNQQAYTGKISDIVFQDSDTDAPWKNDQAIRKIIWTPALKKG